MNTRVKLFAYGAALALLVGGGFAVGTVVGPSFTTATAESSSAGHGAMPGSVSAGAEDTGHGDTHSGTVAGSTVADGLTDQLSGLASSSGGYTFTPTVSTLTAATASDFTFRITGPDGAPVTAFDVEHDKQMHLIVVRRDTTAYQHVHPEMSPDGTWTVPLTVPAGGSYRAFADFRPSGGEASTLGVDLDAVGQYTPVEHQPTRTVQVDGYQVDLVGDLVPGQASGLTLTVSRDGRPVSDLQPYLAAYGHLVALRDGDLAYLHVHPNGSPGDGRTPAGPEVRFVADVPSVGVYRLFLDFQHDGVVRTAEFTVPTGATAAASAPDSTVDGDAADGHGP